MISKVYHQAPTALFPVGMSGQLNNKLTELIFTHLQCMHVDIVVTCMFPAIHMVVQSVDSEK